MDHHDGPVTIIWKDIDGTTTKHDFASPTDPRLDSWLESVLKDNRGPEYTEWIAGFGGPDNGTALLVHYESEDIYEQDDFEVFFGHTGVGVFDLYAAANPDAPCNAPD